MIRRLVRVIAIWGLVIMGGMILSAQDDFDQIYINEAQTFELLYNDDWEITDDDELGVTVSHDDFFAIATFIDPSVFGLDLDGAEDVLDAAEVYTELLEVKSSAKLIADAERPTAVGTIADEDGYDIYIVIQFDDGLYGLVLIAGSDDGIAEAETLVPTYNNVGGNAGTAKLNLKESKNYPNELTDHAETWQEAIEELQREGVIGIGGSLVFNENYAFFSGQGEWFTPLARNSPHTNIIMAGELTFEAGSSTELERCLLSSRITIQGNSATQFLDVGLTNNANLSVYDFHDRDDDPNLAFRQLEVDLDEPIHILYLAIGDSVTVYINGELFIEDTEVIERAGSYGISLFGRGPGARCEGRNIWVYQVPTFEKGVCDVSTGSTVNKRSGPGTTFDRAGQLQAGSVVQAIGQGSDGSFTWWQLEDETWVREDVVNISGDCFNLPNEA
jgi:hypothetical protein